MNFKVLGLLISLFIFGIGEKLMANEPPVFNINIETVALRPSDSVEVYVKIDRKHDDQNENFNVYAKVNNQLIFIKQCKFQKFMQNVEYLNYSIPRGDSNYSTIVLKDIDGLWEISRDFTYSVSRFQITPLNCGVTIDEFNSGTQVNYFNIYDADCEDLSLYFSVKNRLGILGSNRLVLKNSNGEILRSTFIVREGDELIKWSFRYVPTGTYMVNLNHEKDELGILIYIVNPYYITFDNDDVFDKSVSNSGDNIFDAYSSDQLLMALKTTRYLMAPYETNDVDMIISNFNKNEASTFLGDFWKKAEGKNWLSAWNNYQSRVRQVDAEYQTQSKSGYLTDQGKIRLQYGDPAEVKTVNDDTGTWPYEIWIYEKPTTPNYKNGIFLFYKTPNNINEYKTAYSNIDNEYEFNDWRKLLYKDINAKSNLDTKLELIMTQFTD